MAKAVLEEDFEEALEDGGWVRAMEEGKRTPEVNREEVFKIFEGPE